MKLFKLLLLLLCMYAAHAQNSSQEGLAVHLSENGLNYAAKLGADVISEKIKSIKIPNYNGTTTATTFNLYNITMAKFDSPNVTAKINDDQGIIITINAGTEVNLNWEYQIGSGWLRLKDKGTAVFTTSTLSVKMFIKFEKDSTGLPKAKLTNCVAVIEAMDIKFSGKLTTIYKLYTSLYDKKIKNNIETMTCEQATKVLNNETYNVLASLSTQAKVDDQIYLDYTLLASPIVKNGYLETLHVGEFFSDSLRFPPSTSLVLNTQGMSSPTKMVRVMITEKMLNSAAYLYYRLDRLSYALNLSMAEAQNILSINTNYPLMINIKAKGAPSVVIKSNTTTIAAVAEITVNGIIDENNITNLLEANVVIEIEANIFIEGDRIKSNIFNISRKINILKNRLNIVVDDDLISILDQFVEGSQISLNEKGADGFPLPAIKNVNFKNSILKQNDHYFIVDSDLSLVVENNTDINAALPASVQQSLLPAPQSVVGPNSQLVQQSNNTLVDQSGSRLVQQQNNQALPALAQPASQQNQSLPVSGSITSKK